MSRIFYLCSDESKPTGGIRTIYYHVQHLVESGFDASVVHFTPGFKIEWFSSEVPVIDGSKQLHIATNDWVVIPEVFIDALKAFSNIQCHKAVFCQNHYYIFDYMPIDKKWSDYGVERVLVSSRQIQKFVLYVFGIEGVYIPYGIDHMLFCERPEIHRLQIAFMPRKGLWNIRQVQGIIRHRRPDLFKSFPWIAIDGMSEQQTAQTLQQSVFFLSTSFREGFGLPPLEAMACGCIVVGFTGGGGRDYATKKNGFWVPDEDPISLAEALEKILSDYYMDPQSPAWKELREEALKTSKRYSLQRQKERLVNFWANTLT